MIGDYKPYIHSKRDYLKRKKELNRYIKNLKKKVAQNKGFYKTVCSKRIEKTKDSIDRLNIMYRYYRHINKRKKIRYY